MSARLIAKQQSGVALVVVLWMISMMMMIAASLLYSTRTEMGMTTLLQQTTQARAYADAALRYSITQLQIPENLRQLQTRGQPFQWQFEEAKIEIRVIGENGLIDINTADRTLFLAVLKQLGIVDQEAENLLDLIEDFRDEDDLKRLHGAEDNDYVDADLPFGAKDAAFERIEELQQVIGIDVNLYKKLARYLTVNSQSKGINPMLAPRHILMVLADNDAEQVDAYMGLREEAEGRWVQPAFGGNYIDRRQKPTYRIQFKVSLADARSSYYEEHAIRLTPEKLPPFIRYFRKMNHTF